MAKILIKPNPDVTLLANYAKYNATRISHDAGGTVQQQPEDISKRYTRAPGTMFRICANPSMKKNGNLNTGLDIEVPNSFSDVTQFPDSRFKDMLQGKPTALLQHILEFKWRKPFDYLTDRIQDTRDVPAKDITKMLSAFERGEYVLELKDGITTIDTETEFGDIMQYIIRANSLIANSYEELTPNTPFYIAHEAEEAKVKTLNTTITHRAIRVIIDLHDSDNGELLNQLCKAVDSKRRNMTKEIAYQTLNVYINERVENAKAVLAAFELYSNEQTRPLFMARVILYDARYHGIIRLNGATYTWMPPRSKEGMPRDEKVFDRYSGENSIIEFLSHPRFAEEQAEIIEQIKRYD